MSIKVMLLGSAAALVFMPAPLMAQEQGADTLDAGEIVVTAQRRSEKARDVPLSLTAISSAALAGGNVTDTTSLTKLVPGLQLDRVGNFTIPAIRGVTTSVTGPAADANVAIYLDGVYQASNTSNTFDLPDVEQVEVLKGPQGTLFGRNATGGAIQIFTREPSYDFTGSVQASYGNYDDVTVKGFVSGPVVADKVAVSLSGFHQISDSYYRDIRNPGRDLPGAKTWLVRGKIRLDPTENLKVILTGLYSDREETFAIYGTPLEGNTISRVLDPSSIIPTAPYELALDDAAEPQRVRSHAFSGRVEWGVAGGLLTSTTSYSKYKLRNVTDSDYAYAPNGASVNYIVNTRDEYFAQELVYASELSGPVNFVLGGFYTDGKGAYYPIGVSGVSIFGIQHVEAVAGFGEIHFDLASNLSVTGGLRYSWERRELEGAIVPGLNAARPATLIQAGGRSWDSLTPRVSVLYRLDDRNNVYATYSEGFKSGVLNTSKGISLDIANPEKVKAWEVGYKGRLSNSFTLNAAAFYYDYDNLQVTIVPTTLPILSNAAAARTYGLEVESTWQMNDAFDLRAAFSVLDAKYKNFTAASVNLPCTDTANPCGVAGTPINTGNRAVAYDASGQTMIRAPRFSGSLTANGHSRIGGGQLDVSMTAYYASKQYYTFDHRIFQPAYVKLDARAAWSPDDSGLTLAAYVRNLTDEATLGGTFITPAADGVSWAPPRTYGLEMSYRF